MIRITTPTALGRLVDVAARSGDFRLPVATWVQAGAGAAVFISAATAAWPKSAIKKCRRLPTIVTIAADMGQDDDPLPSAWACLPGLVRWAERASILLHAAAGEADHYRVATQEAERRGKVLIVECTPRTLPAWVDALPKGTMLAIVPRGGRHPIAPAAQH